MSNWNCSRKDITVWENKLDELKIRENEVSYLVETDVRGDDWGNDGDSEAFIMITYYKESYLVIDVVIYQYV